MLQFLIIPGKVDVFLLKLAKSRLVLSDSVVKLLNYVLDVLSRGDLLWLDWENVLLLGLDHWLLLGYDMGKLSVLFVKALYLVFKEYGLLVIFGEVLLELLSKTLR